MKKGARMWVLLIAVVAGGAIALYVAKKHVPPPAPAAPAQPAAVSPAAEVQKEHIAENGKGYTISVDYPRTESASVSKYMSDFALKQIDEFKSDVAWLSDPTIPETNETTSLETTYTKTASSTVTTYVFSSTSYTGGAHDLTTTATFSFNNTSGELLTLKNMFTDESQGLNALSKYVVAELKKRNISDDKWIADGAGPTEDNYQSFAFTDTGLEVFFDPYDVAAYAAGPQTVTVPYSVLSAVLVGR